MSKERIDEIIRDHINISYKTNLEHIRRIRKAMEQYGLEQSKDGYVSGSDAVHKILKPELDRLRKLVKAQKELIELLRSEKLNPDAVVRGFELREKIKQLEA